MYSLIYNESLKRAKKKVWILSDLQQKNPDYAKECLDICMDDFNKLNNPADMIWYLGDSVEGANLEHLLLMCDMQEKAFSSLNIPLCYCIGNHDFDYSLSQEQNGKEPYIPFYETVKNHNGWYASNNYKDIYYKVYFDDFVLYFFNDHIANDKSWIATQGDVWGDKSKYPYTEDDYNKIREEMANENKKVITASHYAFMGGNRESATLSKLFPLPENVKIHFCGHAHIGDYDWAKENAYRRISWVNWHDIPQINVSSFEHIRGKKCRSVLLHIYEDNSFGIFFRNHDNHEFSECYFPSKINYKCKKDI